MTRSEYLEGLKAINRDALIDAVARWMLARDREFADYEQDLYLYVESDGCYTLDTYANPGGNSWRCDEHITIVRHTGFDMWECIDSIYDMADALQITYHNLISDAALYHDMDPESIGYWECKAYIISVGLEDLIRQYAYEEVTDLGNYQDGAAWNVNQVLDNEIAQMNIILETYPDTCDREIINQ